MIDEKNKILISSIRKLMRRGAHQNIKKIFRKTRAADIAEVFGELESSDLLVLFNLLPSDDERADVLSHLSENLQKQLVPQLPEHTILTVLDHMDSDDVVDLLGELDEEFSQKIISKMGKEDKEEVEDLMRYPEDSGGGLMTTDILTLDQNLDVQEAIKTLQKNVEEAEATFYVYVIDESKKLVGVLSLKQLLLSKPGDLLKDIMIKDVVSVGLTTDQQEIAKIVERYDFLSVPVVDDSNELMGAITVDDVIDVIREEAEEELLAMGQTRSAETDTLFGQVKSRYPWLLFAFVGGIFSSLMTLQFVVSQQTDFYVYLSTLPLLLLLGVTISNQTVTLVVNDIRNGSLNTIGVLPYVFREFQISLIFSLGAVAVFMGLSYGLSFWLPELAWGVSVGLASQMILASLFGVTVPWLLRRLQLDPAVGSLSLTTVLSHLLSILILFLVI